MRKALSAGVVDIEVALGVGSARATAYGCDLTKGYIDENAAYYSLSRRSEPFDSAQGKPAKGQARPETHPFAALRATDG